MQPTGSSALSRHVKLWFLTLAVLVVLAQTSSDGWLRKCFFGMGKCRRVCGVDEKKKERCGKNTFCCLLVSRSKLSHIPPRKKNAVAAQHVFRHQRMVPGGWGRCCAGDDALVLSCFAIDRFLGLTAELPDY
ncbi:beta-defensin 115 [Meriones unguiculatus]|uniref:beta-defensin 115 n=1 Tax=Meriones unguiculatus TaxID=10047 RepID=UPI00293E19E4|nr:beta-defensin 115 [Meriones unguiculatus]